MNEELNFYKSLVQSSLNGCIVKSSMTNEQVLAIHNDTSIPVKKLTDKSEKQIIAEILNDYMAQKAENIELKKSNKVLKKAITSMSEDYCKDTGKKAFVIGNKTHYLSSAYTDSELCSIYLKQAKKEIEEEEK